MSKPKYQSFLVAVSCVFMSIKPSLLQGQGTLALTNGVTISPSAPKIGESVKVSYQVVNTGDAPLTVPDLFVGCRNPRGLNCDFGGTTVTLQPGQEYTFSKAQVLELPGTYTVWPVGFVSGFWIELRERQTFSVSGEPPVDYTFVPPAQNVSGGGSSFFTVPAGYIHQTDWTGTAGQAHDIQGVYAGNYLGWTSLVWRWADTMRSNSITRITASNGKPAYRMEVTPGDKSSPGTEPATHPRAELFSVDPSEDRREAGHVPPRENILRDGDEYWATFAIFLPSDFPTQQKWATLFQRKLQNLKPGQSYALNWVTLNVHKGVVDVSIPGLPQSAPYTPIGKLANFKNRWTQITVHERVSSRDGLFDLYVNGVKTGATRVGPTVMAGDWNFNFHYGYYRANEPAESDQQGPGVGVVLYTPLLIYRGSSPPVTPSLP